MRLCLRVTFSDEKLSRARKQSVCRQLLFPSSSFCLSIIVGLECSSRVCDAYKSVFFVNTALSLLRDGEAIVKRARVCMNETYTCPLVPFQNTVQPEL